MGSPFDFSFGMNGFNLVSVSVRMGSMFAVSFTMNGFNVQFRYEYVCSISGYQYESVLK